MLSSRWASHQSWVVALPRKAEPADPLNTHNLADMRLFEWGEATCLTGTNGLFPVSTLKVPREGCSVRLAIGRPPGASTNVPGFTVALSWYVRRHTPRVFAVPRNFVRS